MAKKATKEAVEEKVKLFYVDRIKLERATVAVKEGQYKKVEEAYRAFGGLIREGHGYMEV